MNLSQNAKVQIAVTPTAGVAGTDDTVLGTVVDMSGFDGCLMIVSFGAITTNAVTTIKALQDSDAAMGSAADLVDTAQSIAVADAQKTFFVDVYRPRERYVRLAVTRATANAVVASATYLLYGAKKAPPAHGANVAGELHSSPSEGTA